MRITIAEWVRRKLAERGVGVQPPREKPGGLDTNPGRPPSGEPGAVPGPLPTPTPDPEPETPVPVPVPEPTERERFVAGVTARLGGRYCTPPAEGCTDCSGLVRVEFLAATGRTVSGDSHRLYRDLPAVNSGTDLQPGDLVFWDTGYSHRDGNDASHVGVVSRREDGRWLVISALNEQRGIVETPLDAEYGGPYLGARRLPFADEATDPKAFTLPGGAIQTTAPGGGSFGIAWSQVQRWEPTFRAAAKVAGWDAAPLFMALMSVIESRANHYTTGKLTGTRSEVIVRGSDAYDSHPAVGILQIKPYYWQQLDPSADAYTPAGNIRLATLLMQSSIREFGNWEAAIQQRYHPGDDPQSGVSRNEYVRALRELIFEAKGQTAPATPAKPTSNPFPKPVIYDVARDGARFGVTAEEARRLRGNCFPGRSGATPKAVVLHIQDGNTTGSLDWWLHGAGVQASATVMIQRDGSILNVIPEGDGPWTNGDVNAPTAASALLRGRGGNPNIWSLTIEAEGQGGTRFTAAQFTAICWQIAAWMQAYGIPLDQVLRHADINSVTRRNCPGDENYNEVIRQLRAGGFG